MFLALNFVYPFTIYFNVKKKRIGEYGWAVSSTYCTEVGMGKSPAEPVSRAGGRRAGRGKTAGRGE